MDKVFAISMVKNEDDIIQYILDHLLTQEIDHFIIADNMSTDNTRLVLESFAERYPDKFTILDDYETAYYQSVKMNALMNKAVDMGADIILPFDADECFLSVDSSKTVGEALRTMEHPVTVATVWNMVPQPDQIVPSGNPLRDIAWRESVVKSRPSVAFRWEENCILRQGNHDVIHNGARSYDVLMVKHYQYRSLHQLTQKVRQGKAAYDATNLSAEEGYHWRVRGAMSDQELLNDWNNHIHQFGLIYDPVIK